MAALVLVLHGLVGFWLWLETPDKPSSAPPEQPIELWFVPLNVHRADVTPASHAPEREPEPATASQKRENRPRAPASAITGQTPAPVPLKPPQATGPTDAPSVAAEGASLGVTPRAYPEGGDKGRAALTRSLLKRELCIEQRNAGRVMDKDCPVSPPKEVNLPLKAPETRPTKLCLAAREKEWQKYREGRGAYPGLRDLINGKKKCREGWDD